MQTLAGRLENTVWMSEKDKELFRKFCEDAQLKQIGEKRMEKYRTDLCIANSMTGADVYGLIGSLDKLRNAVSKINADKTYSFESKRDCKRTLGSLFNFLHNKDRSMKYAPKELKELVAHRAKAADKKMAKPIIRREELRELLKFANTKEKAMLFLLFESGMRIGEFTQMRKSDIKQIEEGLEIHVPAGKTGERKVVIVEATKYVNKWLEEHPVKGRDAPLFPQPSHYDVSIGGAAITKHIGWVVGRMNASRKEQNLPLFDRPANPHNFRHSRATELGGEPGMTEQIMCKYFGWELDSSMPKTYIHLTDEQVKRAVLRTYGRARNVEDEKIVTHRTCPKCHEENPLTMNFCGRCGFDLDANKMPSKIESLEAEMADMRAQLLKLQNAAARGTVAKAKKWAGVD